MPLRPNLRQVHDLMSGIRDHPVIRDWPAFYHAVANPTPPDDREAADRAYVKSAFEA
jgi:hypothetical protein